MNSVDTKCVLSPCQHEMCVEHHQHGKYIELSHLCLVATNRFVPDGVLGVVNTESVLTPVNTESVLSPVNTKRELSPDEIR